MNHNVDIIDRSFGNHYTKRDTLKRKLDYISNASDTFGNYG